MVQFVDVLSRGRKSSAFHCACSSMRAADPFTSRDGPSLAAVGLYTLCLTLAHRRVSASRGTNHSGVRSRAGFRAVAAWHPRARRH
jgi:hypothetical protein